MREARDIKVLVVDDTAIYRKIVSGSISSLDGVDLLGTAPNGELALRKIERDKPDLVLLDVEMPVMDGLQTLEAIKKRYSDVAVVMVSGVSERHAELTVQALNMGALDFIAKPQTRSMADSRAELAAALDRLLVTVRTQRSLRSSTRRTPVPRPTRKKPALARPTPRKRLAPPPRLSLLAIGVSTGGPRSLNTLVEQLDGRLRLPVLIVQHMPAGFTRSLAAQLDKRTSLSVSEAQDGDLVTRGRVLIAPGGRHMVVSRDTGRLTIQLNDEAPVKAVRPSVDVLFNSLAANLRSPPLCVIMTGMGDDGADGTETLRPMGAWNLAQDEESSVVYGMPRAVFERGLVDEVLSLQQLAPRINQLGGRATGEA